MKRAPPSPRPPSSDSLKAIPYDETTAAKPPVPVTVTTPPSKLAQSAFIGLRLPKHVNQRLSPSTAQGKLHDVRRDSGLAPSTLMSRDSRTTLGTETDSISSIRRSPSALSISSPQNTFQTETLRPTDNVKSPSDSPNGPPDITRSNFMGLQTEIPTGSLEDLTVPGQVDFSKRGSMLIGGKKANTADSEGNANGKAIGSRKQPKGSLLMPPPDLSARALSADEEALSLKVRSLYEGGDGTHLQSMSILRDTNNSGNLGERPLTPAAPVKSISIPEILMNGSASYRGYHELAGGIEDWENLNGGDVDRYGFIVPRKPSSQASSLNSFGANSPEPPRLQRMSTLLQLASETPRRQRSANKKQRSSKSPARSLKTPSISRLPSGLARPTSSQSSYRTINGKESRFRSAANRLPHNKDRRCVDEAGDMLTLPPGLADIAEDEEDGKAAIDLKKREWDREEKWRKMARVVKKDNHGGGMIFEFDTNSLKVVERTWKGIPDRWRATAWHAFLTASAKKRRGCLSDADLIAVFQRLVDQGSPDDVQIDIDVPRTINSHIMFRRRYRGGQRLLFRVLHCLSIYFPDTGYVQGMAALAATILCYFDEEMTFVMLVRLWQLRGLERLYQPGFEGLMQALEEFEKDWMCRGEVATRLTDFGISPTAYGTRWYLTLFNYSIPFPAQLRVWDVFMLLGDPDVPLPPISSVNTPPKSPKSTSFNGGLDVLHAASAALIDGTREILLDSDFENSMKVLTSWIPVKDEEMLMRVAHVEWKMRKRR